MTSPSWYVGLCNFMRPYWWHIKSTKVNVLWSQENLTNCDKQPGIRGLALHVFGSIMHADISVHMDEAKCNRKSICLCYILNTLTKVLRTLTQTHIIYSTVQVQIAKYDTIGHNIPTLYYWGTPANVNVLEVMVVRQCQTQAEFKI